MRKFFLSKDICGVYAFGDDVKDGSASNVDFEKNDVPHLLSVISELHPISRHQ